MPTESNGRAQETTAELLRQRLGGALPLEHIIVDSLLDVLHGYQRDLLPLSGRPLSELILSPITELAVLQTIKDHGKQLARRPGCSDSERDCGLSLYFAAIASALVFHGQKITTHSWESLQRSFAALIEKPWMTQELRALLARAREACRQRV